MNFAKLSRIVAPWALALCMSLLAQNPVKAQTLTAQGTEQTVSYQPPVIPIATNVPATNFSFVPNCTTPTCGPGANTFLVTVSPTVTVRISITNETANACLGTFVISVEASAQASSSFNTQLQQWSSIALISASSSLVSSAAVDLPALSTVYVSTTAISARNVAIQVVNTTGTCSSTNIDVTATLTTVAVTSPLISNTSAGFNGGVTSNVQGIVASGTNGQPVFPVIGGTLQPGANAGFTALGIDTFSTASQLKIDNGSAGTSTSYSQNPPTPTAAGEYAIGFYAEGFINTPNTVSAPWTCIEVSCNSPSVVNPTQLNLATNSSNTLVTSTTFTGGLSTVVRRYSFVLFTKPPTVRQHLASGSLTPAYPSNTLAGSTLLTAVECIGTVANCTVTNITDTQGNVWKAINSVSSVTPALNAGVLSVWGTSSGSAAADTVTITVAGGALGGGNVEILELSAITPANLNLPSSPLFSGGAANSTGAPPSGQLQQSGTFTSYSPSQLGVSALTEPAAGTSALSSIIDTRAAREAVLKFSCTAGAVTLNVQTYAEDGTTALALISPLSAVAAATNTDLTIGSESNPSSNTGTLSATALVRLPQRAIAFSFTNAGGAGTCTARLMLTY